ncbi:MAG TPA: glycosyltransferase family 4 protein [Blastocatellia bacterium]|nr:glycosyltransferase family 4 protein [Blastocatellia bacterium]
MTVKPKRLLVCVFSHHLGGGIERWLDELTAYLPSHGWDVVMGLARGRRYNNPKQWAELFSSRETLEIDGRTGTPEGRVAAVCRAIARTRPDVVMPLGLSDVYRAVARSKRMGVQVRLAIALHAINCELLHDVSRAEPVIDLCVGVNPLQEKFLLHSGTFQPEHVKTIVNGVPPPTAPNKSEVRKDKAPLRILFIGRLNHQHKRVLDLVPLVDQLDMRGVNFQLTVAGSGESERELKDRLHQRILAGQIVFTGYLPPDEVYRSVYPRQDALVVLSPSLGEACPLVIEEAMAHGVVPVCTDFVGLRSLGFVRHGVTGYIYPCGDVSKAADHFRDLANGSSLLQGMSNACIESARDLALDTAHRKWLDALDDLADRPPRPLPANLGPIALEPLNGRNRLDRLMSPASADRVRRLLRRFPDHPDGWAEWPATLTYVDEDARKTMLSDLCQLDDPGAHGRRQGATTGAD